LATWTKSETDTLEAFVEAVLERVASGVDDVETAKTDLMTFLEIGDRKSAKEAVLSARSLLSMWRGVRVHA
jgi:hypothetical protein